MRDKYPSAPEDLLSVRFTDPAGKALWTNKVRAVPRVGDSVLLFDQDKNPTYAAPVTDVMWSMYHQVAGQIVTVRLGENVDIRPRTPK